MCVTSKPNFFFYFSSKNTWAFFLDFIVIKVSFYVTSSAFVWVITTKILSYLSAHTCAYILGLFCYLLIISFFRNTIFWACSVIFSWYKKRKRMKCMFASNFFSRKKKIALEDLFILIICIYFILCWLTVFGVRFILLVKIECFAFHIWLSGCFSLPWLLLDTHSSIPSDFRRK